jgi:hypothetical protein
MVPGGNPFNDFKELPLFLDKSPNPSWEEEDKHDEDRPDEELPVFRIIRDEIHQIGNHSGSQNRAKKGSQTSHQSHNDHVSRPNPVQGLGEDITEEHTIKGAGHSGKNP